MLKTKDIVEMTVKGIAGILLIFCVSGWVSGIKSPEKTLEYCSIFRQIQIDIRDCVITPDSAKIAFQAVMHNFRSVYNRDSCQAIDSSYFVFPVQYYSPRESIGGRGKGYRPNGFDLFDMNVKGSHPAHDIFVRDRNQDNLDDRTWQPIDVLAFTPGIVVATENSWKYDSDLRGGNWIWIYDPCLDMLFFYAHNNLVIVQPGQWVKAGDKIAEMGRSGFNAFKKRSPTHLHLMTLKLNEDASPEPYDTYDWMLNSRIKE
ncbi:M23 family metallopeptidase [Dyadobacter sp. CY312]|nr:M23 family metallopeptidase [Dyadobacter sp. CY312]